MARMFSEEQIAMANSVDIASFLPVSYTHLDVYKRQGWNRYVVKL